MCVFGDNINTFTHKTEIIVLRYKTKEISSHFFFILLPKAALWQTLASQRGLCNHTPAEESSAAPNVPLFFFFLIISSPTVFFSKGFNMAALFWAASTNVLAPLGAFTSPRWSGSSSGSALGWQGLAASVSLNYTWWGSDLRCWVNWLLAEHSLTSVTGSASPVWKPSFAVTCIRHAYLHRSLFFFFSPFNGSAAFVWWL